MTMCTCPAVRMVGTCGSPTCLNAAPQSPTGGDALPSDARAALEAILALALEQDTCPDANDPALHTPWTEVQELAADALNAHRVPRPARRARQEVTR